VSRDSVACHGDEVNNRNHVAAVNGNRLKSVLCFALYLPLVLAISVAPFRVVAAFAQVDPPHTTNGYVARLLINEVPFPGERAYESETKSQAAMLQILWVLDSRIHYIPKGYRQVQVAGVKSEDIIDIITGTGGRRQCEGFYRDASGKFKTEPRVEERLNNLLRIANSGGKPGRFAAMLNYAQGLARAYIKGGIEEADRYAGLTKVGKVEVTGRAYSWMTDMDSHHPGGNFVTIPATADGSLGGNRFFTLRKTPNENLENGLPHSAAGSDRFAAGVPKHRAVGAQCPGRAVGIDTSCLPANGHALSLSLATGRIGI
jgi:hypothetical protein